MIKIIRKICRAKSIGLIVYLSILFSIILGGIYVSFRPKIEVKGHVAVRKIVVNKSKNSSENKTEPKVTGWSCDAGNCRAGNGVTYECGAIRCDDDIKICGCSCIDVSGAPYPKAYCGDKSPFTDSLSKSDDYPRWIFHPFADPKK